MQISVFAKTSTAALPDDLTSSSPDDLASAGDHHRIPNGSGHAGSITTRADRLPLAPGTRMAP